MNTVIKGCKTIEEFQKTQERMLQLAEKAYNAHKMFCEDWKEGEPIKAWFSDEAEICVEYESGNWWHYKDLDLPFLTWW